MTVSDGHAPRSGVPSYATSHALVTMSNDGRACRPRSFLTSERLRP
jgi:hypothetical protein